jgi:hypothetical protein
VAQQALAQIITAFNALKTTILKIELEKLQQQEEELTQAKVSFSNAKREFGAVSEMTGGGQIYSEQTKGGVEELNLPTVTPKPNLVKVAARAGKSGDNITARLSLIQSKIAEIKAQLSSSQPLQPSFGFSSASA